MPPSPLNPTADGHGNADSSSGGIGHGFVVQGQRQPQRSGTPRSTATHRPGNKPTDKSKLWCSHCGMQKHTRETCFQLLGYPEWWEERQTAKAKMVVGIPTGNEAANSRQPPTGGGNRETANGRGRQGSAAPEVSGGGGSGGGVVGAGHFAERTDQRGGGAQMSGGKGLGSHNPNPKFNLEYLQSDPPGNLLLCQKPHILHMSHLILHKSHDISHFVDYCEKPPDTSKIEQNSPLILKNRFEPLNISPAYTVKGYENDKKG